MDLENSYKTFGHPNIKSLINKQIFSNHLAQVYLFEGPAGVGKKTFCFDLARKILGVENLDTHPDFQLLESEGELTVEPTLKFIERLNLKPFAGQKKVSVINNAEKLNIQSANALLKSLEEPAVGSIVFLLSEGSVLPTIVSRSQRFFFSPLSVKEMQEFAESKKLPANEYLLNLSLGRPGMLVRLAEDSGFEQKIRQWSADWQYLKQSPEAEKVLSISVFAEKEPEELKEIFKFWMLWESRNFPSAKSLAALLEAFYGLAGNFNKKLVLQKLFLNL